MDKFIYNKAMGFISSGDADHSVANFFATDLMTAEDETRMAELICTAVNACIEINPDNPLAVARSIKDIFNASKHRTISKGK